MIVCSLHDTASTVEGLQVYPPAERACGLDLSSDAIQ
jgi:hypothetical protein